LLIVFITPANGFGLPQAQGKPRSALQGRTVHVIRS